MENIITSFNNINLNQEINDILLKIIDYDFDIIAKNYMNNITNFCFESVPEFEYYLTEDNNKLIYNYLINNNKGYDILRYKILDLIIKHNCNIIVIDIKIKAYLDYYLNYIKLNI